MCDVPSPSSGLLRTVPEETVGDLVTSVALLRFMALLGSYPRPDRMKMEEIKSREGIAWLVGLRQKT